MTPTDQTPDAIRAAIAEVLADHPNIKLSVQVHRHVVAADVHDRLAQMGAVPAAGSVTFQRTRDIPSDDGHIHSFVWDSNSGMYCDTCEVRLHFVLANGVDGGAVPATGEDVPTKTELWEAVREVRRAAIHDRRMDNDQSALEYSRAIESMDTLIDRLPIANGEDT